MNGWRGALHSDQAHRTRLRRHQEGKVHIDLFRSFL
jgi:hypothetical protein